MVGTRVTVSPPLWDQRRTGHVALVGLADRPVDLVEREVGVEHRGEWVIVADVGDELDRPPEVPGVVAHTRDHVDGLSGYLRGVDLGWAAGNDVAHLEVPPVGPEEFDPFHEGVRDARDLDGDIGPPAVGEFPDAFDPVLDRLIAVEPDGVVGPNRSARSSRPGTGSMTMAVPPRSFTAAMALSPSPRAPWITTVSVQSAPTLSRPQSTCERAQFTLATATSST
nr:hypothetical protein [Halegenticoccus soli]